MALPVALGAIGRMVTAAGGAGGGATSAGIDTTAKAIFNAQVIASGITQVAGLMKSLGKSLLDLPLAPVKAFGEAAKLVQAPLAVVSHTMDTFSSAIGAAQAPLVGVVASIKTMRDSIGMVGTAVSEFVRLANPVEVQKFNLAMDDFTGVFGKILMPVMKASTALVRGFADVFFGMSNAFARAADKLFEPLTKALPKITNAFGPLVDTISDFVDMASDALAPLVDVGVKMFTELSGLFSKASVAFLDPIMRVMPRIVNVFKSIADSMSRTFDAVMEVLNPIINVVAGIAGAHVELALNALVNVLSLAATAADVFVSALETMMSAFRWIGNKLIELSTALFGSSRFLSGPTRAGRDLAGGSVGAAVRPATIGSVEDYGRKAQQAAFSLGSAADRPEMRTATATEDLLKFMKNEFITKMALEIYDMLPDLPKMPNVVTNPGAAVNNAGKDLEERAERNYNAAKSWIAKQFN